MGNFEKTIAYRNKNPLNIRVSNNSWQGKIGNEGGFEKFSGFSYGYRAAVMIFRSYRKRRVTTLGGIIRNWAPPCENNVKNYINVVVTTMNSLLLAEGRQVSQFTSIDLYDRNLVIAMMMGMTRMEMGANVFQLQKLRPIAGVGYDLAVTRKGF